MENGRAMSTVYTKSPKGSREATGRTHDLSEDLLALLKACKGRFTVDAIAAQAEPEARAGVAADMATLIAQGYLREAPAAWPEGSEPPAGFGAEEAEETDAGEADAMSDTHGEASAGLAAGTEDAEAVVDDAADKLRTDVARRRGQRDENTSELVKQIDEAARLKAEEKAAREAAERARLEAEEEARRQAEEQARLAAAEQARVAAEAEARRQAAEQAWREEEEARQRADEERKRKAAEKKAREEAKEKARLEEEERDRQAIQQRLRKRREKQRKVILPTVLGLLLPPLLGAGILQIYSFDGKRAEFEQVASEILGVPVKAGSARFWFAPAPQWRIDDVQIGADAGTARIARISLGSSALGLFGAPLNFESIGIEQPQLPPAMALKALTGASEHGSLTAGQLRVTGLVFAAGQKDLPPLNLKGAFENGRLSSLSGQGEDAESGRIGFELKRADAWQLTLKATQLRWLLGPEVPLGEVTVSARLTGEDLQVGEFSASLLAGEIKGDGRLSWQDGWRLSGKLNAKSIDAAKLARGWFRDGYVGGELLLVSQAATPKELLPRASLSGSFAMERGALAGVDMDKALQDRGMGEETRFESLGGNLAVESQRIELSAVNLVAADLKASGTLSFDAARNASGRLVVEARSAGARRGLGLKITGTLAAPNYQR
jgi:hypothetical protein